MSEVFPEREVFSCHCGDPSHHFFIMEDTDPDLPQLYIEIKLTQFQGFWKRLRQAIRYLFKSSKGDYYDVVVLEPTQVEMLFVELRESAERLKHITKSNKMK